MLIRLVRRLRAANDGNLAVEFAIAAPFLLLLLLGLIDFGAGINEMQRLRSAARVGAEYAVARPADSAGIATAVSSATEFNGPAPTIVTTNFCECANGTTIACSSTCTTSGVMREYVRVRVTQPFTPILSYAHFAMPNEIAGEAVVRVR